MTNTGRKKRRKNAVVTMAFRLFFVLLLLSMLAAYISNQVTISRSEERRVGKEC